MTSGMNPEVRRWNAMPDLALELTHPVRLICLAALPVLLYYYYRSLVDFPRWQRATSLAVRTVIITLLVLALFFSLD